MAKKSNLEREVKALLGLEPLYDVTIRMVEGVLNFEVFEVDGSEGWRCERLYPIIGKLVEKREYLGLPGLVTFEGGR